MSAVDNIRVLLVDDHFVVRIGLAAIVNSESDMGVVGEASNGQQAVEMFSELSPDIVLMDLRMPVMGGVEATTTILRRHPLARILVLTTYDGDEDIYRALQAGARAYLLKDTPREELLRAIRAVCAGQRYIPAAIASRLADSMPRSDLTSREMEVLNLIVKGFSNKEIAAALGITEGTVKIHVNNIFSKLGVSDRTQAATTALQRGIVHLG